MESLPWSTFTRDLRIFRIHQDEGVGHRGLMDRYNLSYTVISRILKRGSEHLNEPLRPGKGRRREEYS